MVGAAFLSLNKHEIHWKAPCEHQISYHVLKHIPDETTVAKSQTTPLVK